MTPTEKKELIALTRSVSGAGWASKLGPGDLAQALCGLPLMEHPNVLVGLARADDAGVYKLSDDLALVQTVDFFTPVVDDPYTFGQIAVANALSDVYAMGGTPICAMNLVAFPARKMDLAILREILRGGLDKMREADVALVGGHSIDDPEPKYGLSVTGTIHPDRIRTKGGCRPGDALVLTKPLGTGIINTAIKRGIARPHSVEQVVASMSTLNRQAAAMLDEAEVHACTDVTGFGLLGHACEMVEQSDVGFAIAAQAVPVFDDALELAAQGCAPGGLRRNREYRSAMVEVATGVPEALVDVLYDPQTSGGLLAALPRASAEAWVAGLQQVGITASIIGDVVAGGRGLIRVRREA